MKKRLLKMLSASALLLTAATGFAQTPYISDVYSFTKTPNIVYDSTRSYNLLNPATRVSAKLTCDIYSPSGTGAPAPTAPKPLIIVAHTGSFIPALLNSQATGNKDDSTMVELCSRLAKRGFLVVAMNYRLGWNATTTQDSIATKQLLQATYRGIQDMRNCIRFMRKNATVYGVDTSKIIVGGQGTGGYIALALGSIDRKQEIENIAKFQDANFNPMVNINAMGDWMGLGGDPNEVVAGESDIAANAHMVFNFGGAMGDSSWLEANSLPLVSMQSVTDPFAPYKTGNVIVPPTGPTVIPSASGAGDIIPKANSLGVNNKINSKYLVDAYSLYARGKANGENNVFPFFTKTIFNSAPWEWWNETATVGRNFTFFYTQPIPANGKRADSLSMITNPDGHNPVIAKAYIDTVINFITPRIAVQLDLVANTNDAYKTAYNLTTPSNNQLTLIKGVGSQTVNFNWDISNTTGFGNLTYTVKLVKREAANFNTPLATYTTTGKPGKAVSYDIINTLLEANNYEIEDTAYLKWTVEADLNGTKKAASDTFNVSWIYGQVTGVKEVANVSQYLTVFPNPTSDVLNINMDVKAGNASAYTLVDLTGRTLISGNATDNAFSVRVDNVNPGLYFMHVTLKDGSIATKRVVIK
ncbi:MAG: T9SS type A sorting domain-containing protein [Bacteroidota bacterium]